jgi:hypothetical protein
LTNQKQELPIAAMDIMYRLIGFRGEDFSEIDQPETKIAYAAKSVNGSGCNQQTL